ncbi:MAG: hypothetical protein ACK5P7_04135 [Bdellovibrio sp.]|jgi:hypothetical protein
MKRARLGILGLLTVSSIALAQSGPPEYELLCRIKAKELAVDMYRGCITTSRTQQIDQLKKEYQDKLRAMKSDYESQIKKLTGTKASSQLPSKKKLSSKVAKLKPEPKAIAPRPDGLMEEMTIETKSAPLQSGDESMLDIPEPTPIEDVPSAGTY